MDGKWVLSLLGACELRTPSGEVISLANRKAYALLAYLALQTSRDVSRERLAALLWEAASTSQARLNLRKCLSMLRQAAGSEGSPLPIRVTPDALGLDTEHITTDVEIFEAAASASPGRLDFQFLAQLYRGDFLDDLPVRGAPEFENWALLERTRLRERAVAAFSSVADASENPDEQLAAALRVLSLDPLKERGHRLVMRNYMRQGRPGAALKHYHALSETLQRELGTVPEQETRELFQEIARKRRAPRAEVMPFRHESPAPLPAAADNATSRPGRLSIKHAVAVLLGLLLLGGGITIWADRSLTAHLGAYLLPREELPAVAVLPFKSLDRGEDTILLSDGLTEEVIASLSSISDLAVTGRTSIFALKGQNLGPAEIGRKLGVEYLLEGAVRVVEGKMRVTARLIEVGSGTPVWSNDFEGGTDEAFAIQKSIAEAVAKSLHAHLVPARERSEWRSSPGNYRLYLVALGHLRSLEADRVKTAAHLFERLKNLEPKNPLAHIGYAEAILFLARNNLGVSFEEAKAKSIAAADKALALAPALPEAHLVRGAAYHYIFYNYGTQADARLAEEGLKRAVTDNPTPHSLGEFAAFLLNADRTSEAARYLREAVALDPLNIKAQLELGRALEASGRMEEALSQYASLDELYPELAAAKTAAGRMLVRYGHFERAEPWLLEARKTDENIAQSLWLICLYANAGLEGEADKILASMKGEPLETIAQVIRLNLRRDYAGSSRLVEETLRNSRDPIWITGAFSSAVLLHRNEDALTHLKRAAPDMLSDRPPLTLTSIDLAFAAAHVLKETGRRRQAIRIMKAALAGPLARPQLGRPDDHIWRAGAFAELGDHERAIAELRIAATRGYRTLVDANNFMRIEDYPMFEDLRHDPRFKAVIAQVDEKNRESGRLMRLSRTKG